MNQITFYKVSGSGNDFILIDNRNKIIDTNNLSNFIVKICRRKLSVGADGLILIENSDKVDFKWHFFNSDGSRAEMCGNGARCAARFAYMHGIAGSELAFETDAGIISAQIINDRVKIKMTNPTDLKTDYPLELNAGKISVSSINTGVPHVVIEAENADNSDVVTQGREIRFHKQFTPAGTNVNFISRTKKLEGFNVRTYERGVEDETLACGTGAVASAIVMAHKFDLKSPLNLRTRSGSILTIHYQKKDGKFYDIYLEGDARIIYKGELYEEGYR